MVPTLPITMGGCDPEQPAGVLGALGVPGAEGADGAPGVAEPAEPPAAPGDVGAWPGLAAAPGEADAADRWPADAAPGVEALAEPALGGAAVPADPPAAAAVPSAGTPASGTVTGAPGSVGGAASPGAALGAAAPGPALLPFSSALSLSSELRFPQPTAARATSDDTAIARKIRELRRSRALPMPVPPLFVCSSDDELTREPRRVASTYVQSAPACRGSYRH